MSVADIQRRLIALGYTIGKSGPNKDGVDGDFGKLSQLATLAALETSKPALKVPPVPAPLKPPSDKRLDERSERSLVSVHPDLVRVVRRAAEISDVEFIVTEGLRTLERQKQLVASGASKTLNSRHLAAGRLKVSHAVDLAAKVDGAIRWDWPLYAKLAVAMKQAAKDVGVPIEWGGDWRSFKDGPHYQLPFKTYPKEA